MSDERRLPVGQYVVFRTFDPFIEEADVRRAFFRGETFLRIHPHDYEEPVTLNNFTPGSTVYLQYFHLQSIAKVAVTGCKYLYAPVSQPLTVKSCGKPTIGTCCAYHRDMIVKRNERDASTESKRAEVLLAIKNLLEQGFTEDEVFNILTKGEPS